MERAAFERLLTVNLPRVRNAAFKNAAAFNYLHEWEDICQTAILKMLRYCELYEPEKGDLMPWCCSIIVNTIKTHLMHSKPLIEMEEWNTNIIANGVAQAEYDPEEVTQRACIYSLLNQEARLYIEGYNYLEIAARCGFKSKATAMARINQSAEKIRCLLGRKIERYKRDRICVKHEDKI